MSNVAQVRMNDMLIGASALLLGAMLVTTNPHHFPMPELRVLSVDAQEMGRLSPSEQRV